MRVPEGYSLKSIPLAREIKTLGFLSRKRTLFLPEKHYSRKRDDNLRLSAPRLGNGNASISAALALRRSASLAAAYLSARSCPRKRVRDARLCRSKTWSSRKRD